MGSDCQIVSDKVDGKDQLALLMETQDPQDRALADCRDSFVFDRLGFHAGVEFVSLGQIVRPACTAVRAIDRGRGQV